MKVSGVWFPICAPNKSEGNVTLILIKKIYSGNYFPSMTCAHLVWLPRHEPAPSADTRAALRAALHPSVEVCGKLSSQQPLVGLPGRRAGGTRAPLSSRGHRIRSSALLRGVVPCVRAEVSRLPKQPHPDPSALSGAAATGLHWKRKMVSVCGENGALLIFPPSSTRKWLIVCVYFE